MKILIEMDGPLVDVRARYYEVHRRIMIELGLPAVSPDPFWRLVRRDEPTEAFVPGGRAKHAERYARRFTELSECDDVLMLDEAQDDAAGALRSLKPLGESILITLRLNRPGAQDVMNRLDLSAYFLRVCGLSQSQGRREDQLRELAGDARRVLVVAGSEPVIIAAREVDLPVVGVTCGSRTPQNLRRAGADVLFADLDAVSIALATGAEEIQRAGLLPRGV